MLAGIKIWEGKYKTPFLPEFQQWVPDRIKKAYELESPTSRTSWEASEYSITHQELVTNILAAKEILDKQTASLAISTLEKKITTNRCQYSVGEFFAGSAPISQILSGQFEENSQIGVSLFAIDIAPSIVSNSSGINTIQTDIFQNEIPIDNLDLVIDQNGLYSITFGAILSRSQIIERYRTVLEKYHNLLQDKHGTLIINSPLKDNQTENLLSALYNFYIREQEARRNINLIKNGHQYRPFHEDLPYIIKILKQNAELMKNCELLTRQELTTLLDEVGFLVETTEDGIYYGANILIKAIIKS